MGEGPTEEGKAQEAWKEAPWSLKNCPPWGPTPTSTTIPGGVLKICVKRIHGHPINIQQCSLLTNLHQNTEIYHSLSVNIHTRCWFTFVLISAKAGWLSFKALRKPFKKRVNRDNTKFRWGSFLSFVEDPDLSVTTTSLHDLSITHAQGEESTPGVVANTISK